MIGAVIIAPFIAMPLDGWSSSSADNVRTIVFWGAFVLALDLFLEVLWLRVTIGPNGMIVRRHLGRPNTHVPIALVADVQVEQVEPGHYGGQGRRWLREGEALLSRAGEAIRVEQTDGRVLLVSVDDARTGAATLLAHRDRYAARPRHGQRAGGAMS